MEALAIGVLITIMSLWLGSIEIRMRNTNDKLCNKPDRKEVSEEVDVRLEPIRVLQSEIKEDIRHMRDQLDRIIERKD